MRRVSVTTRFSSPDGVCSGFDFTSQVESFGSNAGAAEEIQTRQHGAVVLGLEHGNRKESPVFAARPVAREEIALVALGIGDERRELTGHRPRACRHEEERAIHHHITRAQLFEHRGRPRLVTLEQKTRTRNDPDWVGFEVGIRRPRRVIR